VPASFIRDLWFVVTEATKPTAYWVAEGAPITESKSTFGRKRLTLSKIAGLVTLHL
jgi:HK97 family phage major capsid protein